MNRYLLALALFVQVPATAPAPPQSPAHPQAPARAPADPGRFEVVDDPAVKDKAALIQKAVDAASSWLDAVDRAQPGSNMTATIHLPGSATPWSTFSPVYLDRDRLELAGDGDRSRIQGGGGLGHPIVFVGWRRVSADGFKPGPAIRPDSFGVLDATAAPAAGSRPGLAIGPTFLAGQACAFDRGGLSRQYGGAMTDSWMERSALTYDVCLGPRAGKDSLPAWAFVGSGSGERYPVAFGTLDDQGTFYCWFSLQSKPFSAATTYQCTFRAPTLAGVKRVSFQIDARPAEGPTFAAWVAESAGPGVAVPVSMSIWSGPAIKGPAAFNQNVDRPFLIGQTGGGDALPFGADLAPFNLFGLSVCDGLRYKPAAPGQAQERADGKPISDRWRYFPSGGGTAPEFVDRSCIAFLPLTEPADFSGRHFRVEGGAQAGKDSFLLMGDRNMFGGGGLATQTFNTIRDLQINSGGMYGTAIATAGGVHKLTIARARLSGGNHALLNLRMGANYDNLIQDSVFNAYEAAIQAFKSSYRIRGLTISNGGRDAIRATAANFDVADLTVAVSSSGQEHLARHEMQEYGGVNSYRNVSVDNEDRPFLRAGFLFERHPYGTTRVRVEDVYFAQLGPGVPYIRLRDMAGPPFSWTWQPGILAASGLRCDGPMGAPVEADGPAFRGAVRDSILPGGVSSLGTYGPAAVTVADPLAVTPAPTPTPVPAPAPIPAPSPVVSPD